MEFKKTYIFVITTMIIPDKNMVINDFFDNRSRSVGWYPTFEQANKCVVNNDLDIYEYSNNFVVIEKCLFGLYDCIQEETWYKWDKDLEKYCKCEKPKCYTSVINFGLG